MNSYLLHTPLGDMVALANDDYVYQLHFVDSFSGIKDLHIQSSYNKITQLLAEELEAYFAKKLTSFNVPVLLSGTPFQVQAWQALKAIPYGQTVSYLNQAKNIDAPAAFRAVANANAANKLAIIIPCHRVINHNGKLGGYAGGIERKQWLLDLEMSGPRQ